MKYLLTLLVLVSCASRPPKDPGANSKQGQSVQTKTVSMESKLLASEEQTTLVTEITFPKKGVNVTKFYKNEIKKLYTKAQKKGAIDKVKVITWADLEYPSVHKKELSSDQKKLATNRNNNIEKYLDTLNPKMDVEKISMAERPGTLAKITSRDEVEVKKSLETAGLPNSDTTVKVPAKASKSIIMFVMKKD